jgi:hypothetical protein
VAAVDDSLIPIEQVRRLSETPASQKKLIELDCGHFDVYPGGSHHEARVRRHRMVPRTSPDSSRFGLRIGPNQADRTWVRSGRSCPDENPVPASRTACVHRSDHVKVTGCRAHADRDGGHRPAIVPPGGTPEVAQAVRDCEVDHEVIKDW